MKCIYEASSGLEAQMILDMLHRGGVEGRIDGEYLQGGAGELQAMNMVRVLVNESDYAEAQSIIADWDSQQAEKTELPKPAQKSSRFGIGLLLGSAIGAGATFWVYNNPVAVDGIDHNNDGMMDEKWIYRDNRISSVEVDRNLDGKIDLIHNYSIKGRIQKSELDDNFDGIYESIVVYDNRGNTKLSTSDTDNDGNVDYRIYFKDGVFYETRTTSPLANSPIKIQKYMLNKLVSSEFDSNGDGVYDKAYKYDYYENVK